MYKMPAIRLTFLACALALCGCGRSWERLWGQDTRREPKYIELRPGYLETEIRGDLFFVMDRRIKYARWLSVWACDAAGVCLQLPYYDARSGKTALMLRDAEMSRATFINLNSALPEAATCRIEFVE